ncbi:unnamed protein product [Schistosoma mattheei]|uniref:Uncharacterized protein n=1 Tax=Schistosoma mattheei TaxID=31246 RepID=A0A183P1C7_9TREM|nr:unnamed protein product [Schistosoma mattheei]
MQTENLLIPKQYINSNWPVRYVAVSTDGKKIAVSGRNGFIHYNTDSQRWHVFGNIKQENSLHVFGGMAWWKQYICLTCFTENYGTSEVRVYSSDHKLDNQFSSICDLPSLTLPVIVDNFENLFLVLTNDGCLQIFGLSESVSSKSTVTVSPFKAVNLTDIVIFPACVVRICFTTLKSNAPFTRTTTSGSNLFRNFDPGLCSVESLVMNYSGDVFMLQRSFLDFTPKSHSGTPEEINQQNMVVFDQLLSFGTPLLVASEIEILWSTSCFTTITSQADNDRLSSLNVIDANAYTKDSLWLYSGATGLSVWLPLPQVPSSLAFSFNYESGDNFDMGGSHRAVDRGVRQSSDRKEALQKFRLAIDGDPLVLTVELTRSLHRASRNLVAENSKRPRGKLARWIIRLQEYDFGIGHVPGKETVMANYLPRPVIEAELPLTACAINSLEGDPLELVQQQKADPKLREVIRVIKEKANIDKRTMDKEVIMLLRQK